MITNQSYFGSKGRFPSRAGSGQISMLRNQPGDMLGARIEREMEGAQSESLRETCTWAKARTLGMLICSVSTGQVGVAGFVTGRPSRKAWWLAAVVFIWSASPGLPSSLPWAFFFTSHIWKTICDPIHCIMQSTNWMHLFLAGCSTVSIITHIDGIVAFRDNSCSVLAYISILIVVD